MDLKNIKLSVIVPCYNVSKYIKICIDSILKQTFKDLELIIIDDGSDDNLELIIKEYRDDRITYLFQKNSGVSMARNTGLMHAKGEFITFVDPDDYIDIRTYSDLINKMEAYNADTAIYAMQRESKTKVKPIFLPFSNECILPEKVIKEELIPLMIKANELEETEINGSVCRSIFKRKIVKDIKFKVDIFLQEDLIFCLQGYLKSKTILIINKTYYHYVNHETSATEKYYPSFIEIQQKVNKEIQMILKEYNLFDGLKLRYAAKVMTSYTMALSNLFRKDVPDKINIRKEIMYLCNDFKSNSFLMKPPIRYMNKYRFWTWIFMKMKCILMLDIIYRTKELKRQKNILPKKK